jgi:hypothetical protein
MFSVRRFLADCRSHFDDAVRRVVRCVFLHDLHRDVVNRNARGGLSFKRAVVRVTVKDGVDPEAIDRFFQPGRAKEGENFRRLAFARCANRRIMQQDDAAIGLQLGERLFEPHGMINRFLHEFFHKRFAPRVEHPPAKPPAETAHTGKADAFNFCAISIENGDPGLFENISDKLGLT